MLLLLNGSLKFNIGPKKLNKICYDNPTFSNLIGIDNKHDNL